MPTPHHDDDATRRPAHPDMPAPRTVVLIVAAGSGTRLGAGMPKALVPLADDRSVLEHCLIGVAAAAAAARTPWAGAVVVVPAEPTAASQLTALCAAVTETTGLEIRTVTGGAERSDSVRAGLDACAELVGTDPTAPPAPATSSPATSSPAAARVLVHDAARPFVPPAVFQRVEDALRAGAAAIVPAVPMTDTVKTVRPWDTATAPLQVVNTPARSALRAVQTPQGFDLDALLAAHRSAQAAGGGAAALTDDSMLMEAAGHTVGVVDGAPESFKITTALDLTLANALLAGRATTAPAAPATLTSGDAL